jgi:hypothetical protein
MSTIIVGSYMIRYPLGGMMSYTLQSLVGLQQLGHDVYLVEKAHYHNACFDAAANRMTDDCAYGSGVVRDLLGKFGLQEHWCFVDIHGQHHGLSRAKTAEVFRTADVFIDLGTHGSWLEEAVDVPITVLLDGEPAFTQMKWAQRQETGDPLPAYDYYYSVGQNIGTSRTTAPTAGKAWRHIFYPVVATLFPPIEISPEAPFTTLMNWQSHEPLAFKGVTYGQKDVEFRKFMDLPRLTDQAIEVAIAGRDVPYEQLTAAGWRLSDGHAVSRSYESFCDYVSRSKGEIGICKNVFVATNSGWFGDRNAVYLANGRPVVMQDTGFSAHLPCGEGLFAIHDAEQAADAIDRINADYDRHSRSALAIAHEYLDAPKVLGKLLRDIGLPERAVC